MIRRSRVSGNFTVEQAIGDLGLSADDVMALVIGRAEADGVSPREWVESRRRPGASFRSIAITLDLADIAEGLDDDDLTALAQAIGREVVHPGWLDKAADRLKWHDVPGAVVALVDAMPRHLRTFPEELAAQIRGGVA